MSVFETMTNMGHEQVVFVENQEFGLKAIIAIHNTVLGPSLGGLRIYPYSTEEEALRDVLRLSRGMTYKAAVANLNLGGGKAVIIGDKSTKSEGLFRAFGRAVESLSGRYITAEDMNTTVEDMTHIGKETRWVSGSSTHTGGSGDPSPVTAWGTYQGIRACLEHHFGSPDPRGRSVAIQGVGSVGYHLAKYLSENGAKLYYTDINQNTLRKVQADFGGEVISQEQFYSLECDVLSPCAIGGIFNKFTIPKVTAPIIAGAANNQLGDEENDDNLLLDHGLIYAPDYVINAGGLINVYSELSDLTAQQAWEEAGNIFNTVKNVLRIAEANNITSVEASNKIAEDRIEMAANLKRFHLN